MSKNPTPLDRARDYERERAPKISPEDRPLFHLTPMVGWMNDPNGFCWYRGQYHLFYQYHPYSLQWGPMHWGHAVSRDLLRWTWLPCALAPDTEADAGGCFSGSAVPMKDGRLMLAYTGVRPAGTLRGETQAQCIAVGDGTDFEKFPANPVISREMLPDGYSESDFRDPKIWREADGSLRLIAANRSRDREGAVLIFSSENEGADWRFEREIEAGGGEYGTMWECPDFFPLDGKQVLVVSPQEMQARDEFHAGSVTMAMVGSWDAAACRFTRESAQPVDYGLSFYAPQTLLAPDGRRILIGWMDNWETCKEAPRRHSWYGQMSVPRELFLRDGRLMQRPVREIETLWRDTVRIDGAEVREEISFPGVKGRILDMTIRLDLTGSECRRFTARAAVGGGHYTQIRCDLARGELVFDRSCAGSRRDIVHTRHVQAAPRDGRLTLRLLMDRESVELFINDGERVLTSLIPTPMDADGITFEADAPVRLSVEAHPLGFLS